MSLINTYNREFCCSKCGLIYITEFNNIGSYPNCLECDNDGKGLENPIYACDTTGWFYAHQGVKSKLKRINKDFHYHKNHPYYNRNEEGENNHEKI